MKMPVGMGSSRSLQQQIRDLFDVVDRLGGDWPRVALAALREILALEPTLARARELHDRYENALRQPPTPSSPSTRPSCWPNCWIDKSYFFIAQDLWGD